jgi:hypothetical protein
MVDNGLRHRATTFLREPLLHFALIGVVVFALYGRGDRPQAAPSDRTIEVTQTQVERMVRQFEGVWQRPPTESELAGLIDELIREEIYYREALALGLDTEDTVIRRRLWQKMEFLVEAGLARCRRTRPRSAVIFRPLPSAS